MLKRLSDETGAKGKAVDLMPLIVGHMVPFFIEHNAEAEAIDLLSGWVPRLAARHSLVALPAPLPATGRAPPGGSEAQPAARARRGGRRGRVTDETLRAAPARGLASPPPRHPRLPRLASLPLPPPHPPPPPPLPPTPPPHARRSAAPLSFGPARAARRQDQLRAHRNVPEPGVPVRARARGRAELGVAVSRCARSAGTRNVRLAVRAPARRSSRSPRAPRPRPRPLPSRGARAPPLPLPPLPPSTPHPLVTRLTRLVT